jgi:hypothetical protein
MYTLAFNFKRPNCSPFFYRSNGHYCLRSGKLDMSVLRLLRLRRKDSKKIKCLEGRLDCQIFGGAVRLPNIWRGG